MIKWHTVGKGCIPQQDCVYGEKESEQFTYTAFNINGRNYFPFKEYFEFTFFQISVKRK